MRQALREEKKKHEESKPKRKAAPKKKMAKLEREVDVEDPELGAEEEELRDAMEIEEPDSRQRGRGCGRGRGRGRSGGRGRKTLAAVIREKVPYVPPMDLNMPPEIVAMHDPSKYGDAKEGVTAKEYDEMVAQNAAMNKELSRRHAEREKLKAERERICLKVISDWQEAEQKAKKAEAISAASSRPEKPPAIEAARTDEKKESKKDAEKPENKKRKKDKDNKQESGESGDKPKQDNTRNMAYRQSSMACRPPTWHVVP